MCYPLRVSCLQFRPQNARGLSRGEKLGRSAAMLSEPRRQACAQWCFTAPARSLVAWAAHAEGTSAPFGVASRGRIQVRVSFRYGGFTAPTLGGTRPAAPVRCGTSAPLRRGESYFPEPPLQPAKPNWMEGCYRQQRANAVFVMAHGGSLALLISLVFIWPHFDGLIWPHLDNPGDDNLSRFRDGKESQNGAVRDDPPRPRGGRDDSPTG